MNGLLFTILWFPFLGFALSRVAGRMPWFLAGAGICGAVLFTAGALHIPILPALIALALFAFLAILRGGQALLPVRFSLSRNAWFVAIPAAALLFISATLPLTDYDGRAFWLLKAKALAHEGVVGGPFFHGATFSPRNAYPLLVPLDGATILLAAGELDERHVRWLYALFAIAFALELARRIHWWAGTLFLLLPQISLSHQGSALTAYNDIALGAFAACAFFELLDGESPLRFGFWLSFIAMTKSEGLPVSALFFAAGVYVWRKRIWTALAPYGVALATVMIWRSSVPLSDETNFLAQIGELPAHLPRFGRCLGAIVGEFFDLHDWGLFWIVAAVAVVFQAKRREGALAAFIILPMLALYAAVYAVSPYDLPTLSGDLAPRVLTHLLGPAFVAISGFARSR